MYKSKIFNVIQSTAQGKLAVFSLLLADIFIILGITGAMSEGVGVIFCLAFLVISIILYRDGKNKLYNQSADLMIRTYNNDGTYSDTPYRFTATRNFSGNIAVDDNAKLWMAPRCTGNKVYQYSDLLNFALVEDGNTITSGGVGSALAGGFVFGPVGAIVGGITGKRKSVPTCHKMQVIINVNDLQKPTLYIDLLKKEVQKTSKEYNAAFRTAQELLSALEIISRG